MRFLKPKILLSTRCWSAGGRPSSNWSDPHTSQWPHLAIIMCLRGRATGLVELPTNWDRLTPYGTNLGHFKNSFSTFWLDRSQIWLTHFIWGQSDPIWEQFWKPWRAITFFYTVNSQSVVLYTLSTFHTNQRYHLWISSSILWNENSRGR